MTHRIPLLALMLALAAPGCSKSTTAPSTPGVPKFTATLSPANEVPPITNADANGTGTATITLNTTKDAAGNITAATADFTVTLSGFPANEALTAAHIHNGRAGANAGVVVPVLASGEVTLSASGSGSFTKTAIMVDPTTAQNMLNDPQGFYFNVHTTANTAGAARGQLVRTQ
jgi:hypothetical protein